jgi:hypothetical protein
MHKRARATQGNLGWVEWVTATNLVAEVVHQVDALFTVPQHPCTPGTPRVICRPHLRHSTLKLQGVPTIPARPAYAMRTAHPAEAVRGNGTERAERVRDLKDALRRPRACTGHHTRHHTRRLALHRPPALHCRGYREGVPTIA